ncbi:unnamed protein product, partial [Prorocentrum cordatum]
RGALSRRRASPLGCTGAPRARPRHELRPPALHARRARGRPALPLRRGVLLRGVLRVRLAHGPWCLVPLRRGEPRGDPEARVFAYGKSGTALLVGAALSKGRRAPRPQVGRFVKTKHEDADRSNCIAPSAELLIC